MNIPRSVWWLVIGMALNITGSSFLAFKYDLYERRIRKKLDSFWDCSND